MQAQCACYRADQMALPCTESMTQNRSSNFHRFTRLEHDHGDTTGWRFEAGWFQRVSGLEWAWFRREVEDEET